MLKGTECRNPLCRIGLNAEILYICRIGLNADFLKVLTLRAYMMFIHVQEEMYGGRDDTLSGIGRVRSMHGGYPCTGGDVRSACTVKKEMNIAAAGVNIILDIMLHLEFKNSSFGVQSNSVLGKSAFEISAFSPVRYSNIRHSFTFGLQSNSVFVISALSPIRHSKIRHSVQFGIGDSVFRNSAFSHCHWQDLVTPRPPLLLYSAVDNSSLRYNKISVSYRLL
jgi:hypothetical protein